MRGRRSSRTASGSRADHVVLAVGHSARDTFQMLHRARRPHRGQALFDRLSHRAPAVADRPLPLRRTGRATRSSAPPTTSSCTTAATAARSTASACARAARWWRRPPSPGGVVTNGMSQYSRNERNANAGIVVGITPEDYPGASARRHRLPAPLGGARLRAGRRHLRRARPAASATSSPAAPRRRFGAVLPSYKPGRAPGRSQRRACPTTRSRRSARRSPPSTGRSRASRCTTPC